VDDDDSLANCYFADTRWGREPEAPEAGALICEYPGLSGVYLRPSDLRFEDTGLVPASALRGCFWWTRGGLDKKYPDAAPTKGTYDGVLSAEEICAAIAAGFEVWVMDGPFGSREDAHYVLDVAWESPDSGD
jgi:hypothetical protein